MACIEKFLGRQVGIPEDRRYYVKQGQWGKPDGSRVRFGLSQPALALVGGVKDFDWLVENGTRVSQGDSVIFAITEKILYLDAPLTGLIFFNPAARNDTSLINSDPYEAGWLFAIKPETTVAVSMGELSETGDYMKALKTSEGIRNPEGKKGGTSSICKAVYSGIRTQKLD